MQAVDRFSVRPDPRPDDAPATSTLYNDGVAMLSALPGAVLRAQFSTAEGRWLLLLTHDNPYEERLSAHLLDAGYRRLDTLDVAHPYTPGALEDIVAASSAVDFSFIHPGRCRLHVHSTPRWRRRLFAPIGVSQPGGPWRRHYLEFERLPVERGRD